MMVAGPIESNGDILIGKQNAAPSGALSFGASEADAELGSKCEPLRLLVHTSPLELDARRIPDILRLHSKLAYPFRRRRLDGQQLAFLRERPHAGLCSGRPTMAAQHGYCRKVVVLQLGRCRRGGQLERRNYTSWIG